MHVELIIINLFVGLFFPSSVSLWTEVAIITVAVLAYSILVFVTQSKQQLLPCLYLSKKHNKTTEDHN